MSRRKETLTLSLPEGTKERLEELARRFNIFWGKSPSPSGLVAAIAQQELSVGPPFTLSNLQVQSLNQAVKALVDSGQIEEAQILIRLILEQSNPEEPFRQALLKKASQSVQTWRLVIDEFIAKKQPFILLYRNGQGMEETWTIRHAKLKFYEKRYYLLAWCEETANSSEVPELIHNRTFRLDRILNLLSISIPWREDLDYLNVQVQFFRGLIKTYEPDPSEDIDEHLTEQVRSITKRIVCSFWFLRKIRLYGAECKIISPLSLRNRRIDELNAELEQYTLEQNRLAS